MDAGVFGASSPPSEARRYRGDRLARVASAHAMLDPRNRPHRRPAQRADPHDVGGYNALEGPLLGGCLFSGRVAGRAAAAAVGYPGYPVFCRPAAAPLTVSSSTVPHP